MIKIGIAGCKHSHIFSLAQWIQNNPKTELIGAWEEQKEYRENIPNGSGIAFTYKTYEDMIDDPSIDVVAIGDCYGSRGKIAIAALKKGKHIISDKPLCTSLEELNQIRMLAEEKKLAVGLMLDLRYHSNVLSARKIIQDGMIGEVHNIQFGGQHPLMYGVRPDWYFKEECYGGVINDIGIHGIDLIPYLTGLEIKNIVGVRCWNAYAEQEPTFKDCGQFILELSNQAGVIADISYAMPNSIGYSSPYYWEFRIWGNRGMISFSANTDGVTLYKEGEKSAVQYPKIESVRTILDDLVEEIEGNECVALNTNVNIASSKMCLELQLSTGC